MTKKLSKVFRISPHVRKVIAGSNIYAILEDPVIIIDTGERAERRTVSTFLGGIVDLSTVGKVIFTHLHYDHIGNFDLFPNATFFASREEIESFARTPEDTVLRPDIAGMFNVPLNPIASDDLFDVILTPGHTKGSICLFYKKEGVLFSGDTIFNAKLIGRTDLPTSVPGSMNTSLMHLAELKYRILCPGHDYYDE